MQAIIPRGKLYFTLEEDGAVEFEIGLVQKVSFSTDTTEAKVMDKSAAADRTFDVATTSATSTLSYETQDVKPEVLAQALRAKIEDITYEVGDELPDGTTATEQTTIKRLTGDPMTQMKGKFRFESSVATTDGYPQLTIPSAFVKPDGTFDLIADDFISLSFKGEAMLSATNEALYYLDYL